MLCIEAEVYFVNGVEVVFCYVTVFQWCSILKVYAEFTFYKFHYPGTAPLYRFPVGILDGAVEVGPGAGGHRHVVGAHGGEEHGVEPRVLVLVQEVVVRVGGGARD